MTIRKRNHIIRQLAERIALLDAALALHWHQIDDDDHSALCCNFVYEDAARNTYNHLSNRRAYHTLTGGVRPAPGIAELRGILARAFAEHRDIVVAHLVYDSARRGIPPVSVWYAPWIAPAPGGVPS